MTEPRLTSLSSGGGCGCKISPQVLAEILQASAKNMPTLIPPELLVGIETADDAAVYQINDEQALIATTDFFMPIVDNPFDFGCIAATNAISDVYAMGGRPIMALALVGMPTDVISTQTIGQILQGGQSVCAKAGIPIAGGHTIDSVEPIYGLVVMGLVHPANIKRNSGAQLDDVLVLGKPLGVGVMAAALKNEKLSANGYAQMIASTTQLNTAGAELGLLSGVHALTDVTGFGLAGHTLEMVRGANSEHAQLSRMRDSAAQGLPPCVMEIDFAKVPLLPDVRELAAQGFVTGASARNWDSYGECIKLMTQDANSRQAQLVKDLLTDPQTSGGLLVSCSRAALPQVMRVFEQHGFDQAAVIGQVILCDGQAAMNQRGKIQLRVVC